MANVRIEWDRPLNDGGSPITDYQYRYRVIGEETWSDYISAGADDLFEIIAGLAENDYEFEVFAVNAVGLSEPSERATITLGETPVVPDVPDTTRPTVAIAFGVEIGESVTGPFVLGIKFSEPVFGFTADDVTVAGGTVSEFSGNNTTYILLITPTLTDSGLITVSIAANVAQDAAGNGNQASLQGSVFYRRPDTMMPAVSDTTAPTVTLTRTGSVIVSEAFTLAIAYSESVRNFVESDPSIEGASLSNFSSTNGRLYTATVTPELTSDGEIKISIPAGVAEDAAGNANEASNELVIPYLHPVSTITEEQPQPRTEIGGEIVIKRGIWLPRIVVSERNSSDGITAHRWNVSNGRYIQFGSEDIMCSIQGIAATDREAEATGTPTAAAYFTPPVPIGYPGPNEEVRFTTFEEGTAAALMAIEKAVIATASDANLSIIVSIGDSDDTSAVNDDGSDAEYAENVRRGLRTDNYSFLIKAYGADASSLSFDLALWYRSGVWQPGTAPTIVGGTLETFPWQSDS